MFFKVMASLDLEGNIRNYISGTLRHAAETTIQLVRLFPEPFSEIQVVGSKRSFSILLQHTAYIPQEELMFMDGHSKEEVHALEPRPILSASAFEEEMNKSIKYFSEGIAYIFLQKEYSNSQGTTLTGMEWCLETIGHLYHHRGQVFSTARHESIDVPEPLLRKLFPGHLL